MPVTLLLADDSATIQRVIEMTFAEEDVRVVTVGDGGEAIERIAADPPDIVLADTNMPGKDGYEVSAFVKADTARSRIPVVLLTGAFEPVDDERAREVGCDAVLVKPFEPKAVIERVRELVGPPPDAAASTAGDAAARDGAPDGGSGGADGETVAGVVPDGSPAAADSVGSAVADSPPADDAPAAPVSTAAAAADSSPVASAPASPAPDARPGGLSAPAPSPVPSEPLPIDPESPSAGEAPAVTPEASAGGPDVEPRPAPAAPTAVPAVESPAPPSLAAAFASLLAAEQGDLERARAAYPWPRPPAPPSEDDLVERVAERVVERLSNDVTGELVSEVVARVAERLVRDQIGRINPA